ncbi:DsrE family protein [Christiangramia marina]|uniref:DsrE family protein n=1 Tax=Christiangramia marina TaxID=409436 RepID=UPI003AA7F297
MKKLILLFTILWVNLSFAQKFEPGNVIPEYGKTIIVPHAEIEVDTNLVYKVVFDIDRNFDPAEVNKLVETAARFLNMHQKAGVDPENMHLALVFHGSATKDVLDDASYSKAYPDTEENPNTPLFTALANAGTELIVCGQSAAHHNVDPENVHKDIKYALSAMTALVQLQADGYHLIKF